MARISSDMSNKISLAACFIPDFLHGIGELKGLALAFDNPEMPAFVIIEFSRDGGITMSRRALRSVVRGYPLSSISSSSYSVVRQITDLLKQVQIEAQTW